jgi:hypothetical protein
MYFYYWAQQPEARMTQWKNVVGVGVGVLLVAGLGVWLWQRHAGSAAPEPAVRPSASEITGSTTGGSARPLETPADRPEDAGPKESGKTPPEDQPLPEVTASERKMATEAVHFLVLVQAAQQQYYARHGVYAAHLADLADLTAPPPKDFTVGPILAGSTGTLAESWRLTVTRQANTTGYGQYTLTYHQDGFDRTRSSIINLPAINPLSNVRN